MLILLSIGLVNIDDISLIKSEINPLTVVDEVRLFWRSEGDGRSYSVISEVDFNKLLDVAVRQSAALPR